jgi:hypothetical protein
MLALLLLLLAFVCFVLAAVGVPSRVNFVALGLMFWVLLDLLRVMHLGF